MKTRLRLLTAAAAVIALFVLAAPPSSAFIYQGVLSQNGTNAQGNFEMRFQLRLAGTTTDVGDPITSPVRITDGLFSLDLDFPPILFDGTAYDLQISVRAGGSTDPFIPLVPAQPLAAAPQALFADSVGSVPDDALASNVARLNQPAVFVTNVSMPLLRLANPTGGGSLIFGPTDDCSIGVEPGGSSGLLLRDPRGIRVLSPDPVTSPPTLRFGPTDDCSIGIDPAFPGLIGRDPVGLRLLGQNNQGQRLIFGPTMDCTVEVDPFGPAGLLLRDPRGIRLLSPNPATSPRLLFGPTDDCSLGIDPAMPGLIERDPTGFRLLGQDNQGCRLIFGPTMDCTVEIQPGGPAGLLLRDPRGIRILPPAAALGSPPGDPRLIFGPTDDCSLGIDPTGENAGLIIEENFGVRVTNPSGGASRVILGSGFGNNPDNLCIIAVDPTGPSGIQLRDPSGVRLLSPPGGAPRLMFGPTDDCSLGIDPAGPQGLLLRDPRGIRLLSPSPAPGNPPTAPRLIFGPTDDCSIGIDPTGVDSGLVVYEKNGLRLANPNGGVSRLMFGPGPDNLCSIAVDPSGPAGLLLRDPRGIRVLPPAAAQGSPPNAPRLIFGPTDDCSLGIDPAGPAGLLLRDPRGIRILNPAVGFAPTLIFGPTDDCSIRVASPGAGGAGGMFFRDPNGFQFTTPSGDPANVEVVGVVRAQAFVQTSTRRLKENVQPLENALELIQQLQGVRYDWKAEMGGEADLGFIAEEVGKVIPEVVEWEEDGVNARGIDYARLVAVAMEGIKAQQTEIETLRKERADMETRLSRLEALLQTTRPGQ